LDFASYRYFSSKSIQSKKLKSDLEGEVINGEKLNNSLCVSKAMVNTLNIKYAEVAEQLKQNAKTVENHDSNAKALKKTKAEVTRLTNKKGKHR
jgi:hypothetical protein